MQRQKRLRVFPQGLSPNEPGGFMSDLKVRPPNGALASSRVLKNVATRHLEEPACPGRRSDEKSLFVLAFLKRDFSLRSK
jgi:hypothetical protein